MSENVLSSGFMAPLLVPVDYEEVSEDLYHNSSELLQINYEGTILFSDTRDDYPYGLFFEDHKMNGVKNFIREADRLGFNIDQTNIRRYRCIWYNGVDSDMDTLKLDDFLRSKQ